MESSENREQQLKANQPTEKSNNPPLSKVETLKLLNESIDKLEETIKGISESPNNYLPSSASINDLVKTTQELSNAVAPANTTPKPQPIVKEAPATKTKLPLADKKLESTPSSPKTKVSTVKAKKQEKFGLIAIGVFAIAMAVVVVFWLWLPQRQARLAAITQPEPQEVIADGNTVSVPETINTPEAEPVDIVPNSAAQPETTFELESPTEAEIAIPSELTSPGRAKNLKMVTIEPELTFTPEQILIAALQTKIAKISQDYSPDIVDSIKVDLPQSSLLIKVTDNWYELNESGQSKIANEILERSRKLQFNKLELQDLTGTLVARNPVIGNQIIILESSKNNDAADVRSNFAP